MKRVGFFGVVLATLLFALGGCSQERLDQADGVVADANAIGGAVQEIAHGPLGDLLPPQVVQIMELLGIGIVAAAALYQKLKASGLLSKNQDLATTLRIVVDAVDASGEQGENVKANVLALATKRRAYDTADAVIDEHRTAKQRPAGV